MGLPFLDRKNISGSIIAMKRNKPDLEVNPEESDMDPGLLSACEDIMRAIDAKSPHDLAQALQCAFQCMEAQPHEEAGE